MKHLVKVEEKAGLTANLPADVEAQKPIYIEDKWSWSSYLHDPLARKRIVLGGIGCSLLLLSFYFGYKAGTTAPGIQTLSTPNDLVPALDDRAIESTVVRVKMPHIHNELTRHDDGSDPN
ncbi:hypothetical protein H310_14712 [Aphanomyces invadans]|uniref:Uncharacterized protein n=1 Tax=Aphanomyces invadans TaxID=157072 RepID=A0A024TB16_9STRA|nr:hypothetical protein H310_14712 [Aphanomyces invadans]ETV90522.1 hypothetical protein H310_14712 [Aphanomyces invadans]|eukprot:XP_008880838.1 hypothetical protein H310_14712 [Aphanomyces invadans]